MDTRASAAGASSEQRRSTSTVNEHVHKLPRYCRRAALKRMTRDIKEDADEERRTMGNKSDGMDNVFLGNDRQVKKYEELYRDAFLFEIRPSLGCGTRDREPKRAGRYCCYYPCVCCPEFRHTSLRHRRVLPLRCDSECFLCVSKRHKSPTVNFGIYVGQT